MTRDEHVSHGLAVADAARPSGAGRGGSEQVRRFAPARSNSSASVTRSIIGLALRTHARILDQRPLAPPKNLLLLAE